MSNFIKALRNSTLFATREAATEKLIERLTAVTDGEICIATYGTDWQNAKTIFGFARYKDGKHSYTIYDNEAYSEEISTEIGKLDATKEGTSTDGHVKVEVIQEDGKITTVNVTTNDIAADSEVIKSMVINGVDATVSDNKATVTIDGADIAVADSYTATKYSEPFEAKASHVAATDKVDAAFKKVETTIGVLVDDVISNEKVSSEGISKLAESAGTVDTEGVIGYVQKTDANYISEAVSVHDATVKLDAAIKSVETGSFKYKVVTLTEAEVAALGDANVKEAYKVVSYTGNWDTATDKTQVGDTIKIYKDSSVKEIYLGSSDDTINATTGVITKVTPTEKKLSLNYAYVKADGTYGMAYIPVDSILRESEFKDGLQVINGEVSVKKDDDSEDFLSVSSAGVKISGVQNAINTAVSDLIKNINVNGVAGTVANNIASLTIDGADIAVADSYTATKYSEPFEAKASHVAATDKVDAAIKKVETTIGVLVDEVLDNEKVTSESVGALAEAAGTVDEEGVIGYVQKTDANYISEATSVHDATVKLDAAIKSMSDGGLNKVNGSNAITVSEKASNEQTVSLKLDAVKTDNALSITTNGLYLSNVWDCGEY